MLVIPSNNELWLHCVPIGIAYLWLTATILPLANGMDSDAGYRPYAAAYGWTGGWRVERMNGWMERMDGWAWKNGWMNGWVNGWVGEWTDGWLDRWLDAWLIECVRWLFVSSRPAGPLAWRKTP